MPLNYIYLLLSFPFKSTEGRVKPKFAEFFIFLGALYILKGTSAALMGTSILALWCAAYYSVLFSFASEMEVKEQTAINLFGLKREMPPNGWYYFRRRNLHFLLNYWTQFSGYINIIYDRGSVAVIIPLSANAATGLRFSLFTASCLHHVVRREIVTVNSALMLYRGATFLVVRYIPEDNTIEAAEHVVAALQRGFKTWQALLPGFVVGKPQKASVPSILEANNAAHLVFNDGKCWLSEGDYTLLEGEYQLDSDTVIIVKSLTEKNCAIQIKNTTTGAEGYQELTWGQMVQTYKSALPIYPLN